MAKSTSSKDSVERALKRSPLQVQKGIVVGSSSPDFYVVSPNGTSAVVEVKTWKANPSNVKFASALADSYRLQSGADRAFVVLPGLIREYPNKGVVSPRYVANVVRSLPPPTSQRKRKPKVRARPAKYLFGAMPFEERFELVFDAALRPAALDAGYDLRRVDRESFTGDIVKEITRLVRASVCVLADLSGLNDNVIYEIGLAHGCRRDVIQLSSTHLRDLPFNLRNNKTIHYRHDRLPQLRRHLAAEIAAVLKRR